MSTASAEPQSAAEAMDGIYRHQRHIYDLTRYAYLLGRDGLLARLDVPSGGRGLEVGCGTGRNLVHAARRYPDARFYGIDVSAAMLETARRSIVWSGVGERVICAEGDATDFDTKRIFGQSGFDRVFISYALSMIADWRAVLSRSAQALAPGGELNIVDFGDFAGLPSPLRRLQRAWLARFSVTPIPDFERHLAAWAAETGMCCRTERLYGGYAILARLSRS